MINFLRLVQAGILSFFQPRLRDFGEPHTATFRVQLWDLDIYRHVNNATYLNFMETARWGMVFRAGFFFHALKRGWILPIAKIDIRYLRPLTFWQKFTVRAQIISYSERWVYVHQVFMSRDKMVAHALVRSAVASKRGLVPPREFLASIGLAANEMQIPPEIEDWFQTFQKEERVMRPAALANKTAK